jgi:DNA-binding MarR family transcriptional regulator
MPVVSPDTADPYNPRVEDLLRECLGLRLGAAYRRVDRLFSRTLRRIGLTHAHGHVLACVIARPDRRLRDLAAQTGLEASTVSRLVDGLARRKFVRRRPDPEDRRSVLVSPGARAELLRVELERLLRRADDRLRRDLPQADLQGMLRAIEIMDLLP